MRRGNVVALTILAAAWAGLGTRAVVALSQDRPARPIANPTSSTVDISGFAFPETVTIAAGGTLTWLNHDGAAHTVTFASSPAPTPAELSLAPGATGTVTFTAAGSYDYACQIHPSMTGRVEVTASSATPDPYDPYASGAGDEGGLE